MEEYLVILNRKFVFGKKINAPNKPNKRYDKAAASASVLPVIIETKKRSVNVPKLAPRMKGIAFFKLIKRATARGTSNPMVILDEKTVIQGGRA